MNDPKEQLQKIAETSGVPIQTLITLAYRVNKDEERRKAEINANNQKVIEGLKTQVENIKLSNDQMAETLRGVALRKKMNRLNNRLKVSNAIHNLFHKKAK